jgi:ASC-1-like (ASCH) protein
VIERINQQPRRQIANADAVVFFKTARRVVEKINLSRRLTFRESFVYFQQIG